MSVRYLFGPVTSCFVDRNLQKPCASAECLPFDSQGRLPFFVTDCDSWQTILQRLPCTWQPDFIVLDCHFTTIPPCLWNAPVPLIGLAADWNLLWHGYRRLLPHVDLVLTDTEGVERLAKEGIRHAVPANLFGLEEGWLSEPVPNHDQRDIDILFVGNLHPAVQRERLPYLGRLAALGKRWNVVIAQSVFDDDYRSLMRRARTVFNRSIRGECNMRAFEAAAAGALLFQERGNREIGEYFHDRQECILYDDQNLESLLTHYLKHEPERRAIADAAQSVVDQFTFAKLWQAQVSRITELLPTLQERARRRLAKGEPVSLIGRVWQALGSTLPRTDHTLFADLKQAQTNDSNRADMQNNLGLATAALEPEAGLQPVGEAFLRAVRSDSQHVVACLNLTEALAKVCQFDAAIAEAKQALGVLEVGFSKTLPDPCWLDAPHYPNGFDSFRVEWERAAWQNAGNHSAEADAKRRLVRWRLDTLLAELTKSLHHYYEAVLARPDLPSSQAALGCALAREGQPEKAIRHLRAAVEKNPFDLLAARALFQALKDAGNVDGQRELGHHRRLLAKAAGRVVPVEPWFDEPMVHMASAAPAVPLPDPTTLLNIVWEGDHQQIHSLAMVNRATCRQLLQRGHRLAALPSGHRDTDEQTETSIKQLHKFFSKTPHQTPDVYVRHQWPPRFTPPPMGRWVVMQQWEFGSLPCSWIQPMRDLVDEIWVASRWVRRCYIESGIPGERVHVVRQGVDPDTFPADVAPLSLRTRKQFKFLFVGGSIHRKGIDILLDVYTRTFTSRDDVCLVIKDMGGGSFYRGMTAERQIAELQAKAGAPEIEYLTRNLNTQEIAGLYAACDCLVHPFRGEGFGLPITEAMASGRAVIVTGYGPTLDYCSDTAAYLIPAREVHFPEKRIGDEPTVDYPWLAEPDRDALQTFMCRVFENPQEARAKGQAAREHINANFTWERSVAEIEKRVQALREQPIRRTGARGTRSEGANPTNPGAGSRPHLSACLIVKNEENNLAPCLESILGVADELVVVDTGSTDRTMEIAKQYGARVFEFAWVDSFSAARNECLRHATGDWIFWMDADDRLDANNRERLRQVAERLRLNQSPAGNANEVGPYDAFVMTCRCLSGRGDATVTEVQHVRLFRNHPKIRWEQRIHEQVLPAVRRMGGAPRFTDVVIEHVGYQDPKLRVRKRERDLRLLQMEYAEQPDHPFTLFNLGMTYLDLERGQDALPLLQKSLDLSAPQDSIVRKLYYMIVQSHRQMGQQREALTACRKGREVYPQDAELLAQEGLLLNEQNDLSGAEQCYLKLLSDREAPHFASVPVGLNGYLTRHNLAVVYMRQQRVTDAEAQWRAATEEKPEFASPWLGLEDLYVTQGRWEDLESLACAMEKQKTMNGQASIARARGHLGRREFREAMALLEVLIGHDPQALRPRVLLTHVLLQENRDLDAASLALQAILDLDPEHPEARQNLAVLRSRFQDANGKRI
jgi:glycosyltransferase involved in cell wall biosynthesis